MNTAAFNQAVAAVSAAGGGTLVVPVGAFVTGPFNLTSRMTLFLAAGAEIRAPSAAQLGGGPAFPRWPVVAPLPSYGPFLIALFAKPSLPWNMVSISFMSASYFEPPLSYGLILFCFVRQVRAGTTRDPAAPRSSAGLGWTMLC